MPTYVFEFTAATDDVRTWKEIPLTFGAGSYAHTSLGDQLVALSVTTTFGLGAETDLSLVWVEGTNSTTGTTQGVINIATATCISDNNRRTALNNASGGYVNTVSFSPQDDFHQNTIGIGPMRDLRISPVPLRDARLYIGCIAIGGTGTVTVYVTTSRII